MSLLVGLRGQTRENEGAGLREGITQQPGPFYNNNPSSIIWGNPPPSPLWRDDSGSPFFKTKYSGFGNSKPQQFGREEKQKEGPQMVAEGKTSFLVKRTPVHSESILNLNSNPASSPFSFGFPPQQSSGSSPSPALRSERRGMPTFGASGSSLGASGSAFMAFGSSDFTRGTSGAGASGAGGDGLKTRSWAIPTSQEERVNEVGMVTPIMGTLTLNDQGNDSKFFVDTKERDAGPRESSPPPGMGSDLTGKFSSLGINNSHEPSVSRQDKPGVFVFGANLAGNESVPVKLQSPDVPGHPARPRPLKVKRSVLTAKGKGIAAGNGASSATSSEGLHVKGSRPINGECQRSQPTIGLDQPPLRNHIHSNENSPFQNFTSPSSPLPEQSNSVSSGQPLSPREQFSFSAGHQPFLNFEFGKNNRSAEESNVRSEDSSVAEALLSASTVKIDVSGSPLSSRNPNIESGRLDSSSSPSNSVNLSLGDFSDNTSENVSGKGEFTPDHVVMKGQATEDLSSELALKLGLGSGSGGGVHEEKGCFAESNLASKSAETGKTESGVSPRGEVPSTLNSANEEMEPTALNSANEEMKPMKENQDGESSQFSAMSSSSTPDFLRFVKDATSEIPRRPFEAASRTKTEPDNLNTRTEPFVFGASRNQATSVRPRTMKSPSAFKSYGALRSTSPSLSSSSEGALGGKTANLSTSDLLSSKQKVLTPKGIASFETDLDSLPFSFSAFNLGAAKPSVQADEARGPTCVPLFAQRPMFNPGPLKASVQADETRKPDGIPSYAKRPTASRMSSGNLKGDSVDSTLYGSAPSRFVFSAGTDPTSSLRTSSPAIPSEDKFINGFRQGATADSSATSAFFEAQSGSQSSGTGSKTFEFRAGNDASSESGKLHGARKKTYRPHTSIGRRQSRSTAVSKERPNSFMSSGESASNFDEDGSPMDFSPQRYTPPDDSMPGIQQTSERAAWENRSPPSTVKFGLEVDNDWIQYTETEAGLENLRKAAGDPAIDTRSGGRDAWKEMAKDEDESIWWTGKENVPRKSMGRSGKWKQAVFDENPVPFAGRDNTWSGVKLDTNNRPDSAASSSTPSADSSASSSGWGQFTFTAGSSNFSSTTSFLRRHARRIQKEKLVSGSGGIKSGSSNYKGESTSSPMTGLRHGAASTPGTASTTSRPAFSFDGRVNPSESGRAFTAARNGNWDQARMPSAFLSSGSNSWSSESSASVGSLPRSDGAKPTSPQIVGAAATEQVCEKWRLRGNQAYADGDFPKAEEYYSRGASSVSPNETSQSCIRASMLCYSNRAATRMVVGRMREALGDCMRAMAVDPNFLRVRLRAASCHLALGEIDSAARAFEECLRRVKEDDQPDSKVSSEASEGLRKLKQVDEYLDRACEILAKGSSGDTPTALRLLNEALLSSPHSEKAIELKGRALLVLRRYEEVVQISEQSLLTAERNHPVPNGDSAIHQLLQSAAGDTVKVGGTATSLKMWRWQLTAKAKFHLGRLEDALEILQKSDEMTKDLSKDGNSSGCPSNADPSALSIGIIRDLLRHKAAGNDAFQSGKHTEAVEHYSAALACNGDSRPFNAVCFCNRAAASQALGNIADAISDCSRAIALDPKYAKAISRRATLHEKVRDYGQSCHDLQKLVALLESQQQQARAVLTPGWAGRPITNAQQDLWQARDRLVKAEDEMKKGHPLDHYMILGLEPGCSSNEIKKAYRKAALRHHPDKAGQFLGRSDGGDDGGMWKEVTDEVRSDAERLFKLIGEANAILSDNQKRSRYDSEEEFRKLRTRSSSAACGFSDLYRSTERGHASSGRRSRERWDSWTGYGHQNQRWQSGPDAAQPDTYARRGRYGSNNSSRSNGDGGRWNDYDWDDM